MRERCNLVEKYVINGGATLRGEVEISGAKNAAVAIIPAALLVDGVCRIENIPQISDAFSAISARRSDLSTGRRSRSTARTSTVLTLRSI